MVAGWHSNEQSHQEKDNRHERDDHTNRKEEREGENRALLKTALVCNDYGVSIYIHTRRSAALLDGAQTNTRLPLLST